jgi:hypothetical protein
MGYDVISRCSRFINVTEPPTAEWIARRLIEAFPIASRRATYSVIEIRSAEQSFEVE